MNVHRVHGTTGAGSGVDLVIHGPTLVIAGCFGFPKNDTPARLANLRRRLACGKDTTGSAYSYCFPQQLFVLLFDHPPRPPIDEPLNSAWSHPQQATARWLEEGSTACLPAGVCTVQYGPQTPLPQTPIIDQTQTRMPTLN